MPRRWIQNAIKRPGALRKAAKRARMSTFAYARAVVRSPHRYPKRTVRQARLALKLMSFNRNRRHTP